jgi:ATP-binding cassette subfamily F protein 3
MLRARGITRAFGARTLLDHVDLELRAEDRVGLVGRNGEGKTTLLRILAGLDVPDAGRVELERGAHVALLRQEIDPGAGRSLIDEVRTAHAPLRQLEHQIETLEREIEREGEREVSGKLAERYDAARLAFERAGGYEAEAQLRSTLAGLGFARERWERPLAELSGGWLMRVELAKLLLARPEVLLLDEPTNHLDLPSIAWFEETLADYPGAVLVVSHDRAFLDRHVRRIAELRDARLNLYTGNYSEYERLHAERLRLEQARRRNIDQKIAHAERFVERFGAKATKAAQARSRKKQIERLRAERPDEVRDSRGMRLRFPPAARSGDLVLRLENVALAYGEHRVYDGLGLEITRGDRIALVGPNGAGKSTLLRLVAGSLTPDRGDREVGHNVRLAFYAQHQLEALQPERSVLEELERAAPGLGIPRARTLLGAFLFTADDVDKKVSVLSGGEKARLALARLLVQGANLIVLDEPTNHLDMQAREVLAEALAGFDGTLVLISHDRSFINALCNKVWDVVPGETCSQVRLYPGNYDDYRAVTRPLEVGPATGAPPPAAKPASTPVAARAPESREDRARRKADRRAGERRMRSLQARCADLEEQIVETEKEVERLGLQSADPVVARDGDRMRSLELERRALESRLPELYAEWERKSAELEVATQALAE